MNIGLKNTEEVLLDGKKVKVIQAKVAPKRISSPAQRYVESNESKPITNLRRRRSPEDEEKFEAKHIAKRQCLERRVAQLNQNSPVVTAEVIDLNANKYPEWGQTKQLFIQFLKKTNRIGLLESLKDVNNPSFVENEYHLFFMMSQWLINQNEFEKAEHLLLALVVNQKFSLEQKINFNYLLVVVYRESKCIQKLEVVLNWIVKYMGHLSSANVSVLLLGFSLLYSSKNESIKSMVFDILALGVLLEDEIDRKDLLANRINRVESHGTCLKISQAIGNNELNDVSSIYVSMLYMTLSFLSLKEKKPLRSMMYDVMALSVLVQKKNDDIYLDAYMHPDIINKRLQKVKSHGNFSVIMMKMHNSREFSENEAINFFNELLKIKTFIS